MSHLAALRYRQVAFTAVDVPLRADALAGFLVGREAYRRTRLIVARGESGMALVRVRKQSEEPLSSPIVAAELLAGPAETEFVAAPGVDVGVPSQLARAAAQARPGTECVVVQGLYEHVSFILNPDPVPVRVVDAAPPYPAKLVDQAERLLGVVKTPSARSDNLIFAYGEVSRAHDLARKVTRLMTGVAATLRVNAERMRQALSTGFSQGVAEDALLTMGREVAKE